jgi:hypothetical protein
MAAHASDPDAEEIAGWDRDRSFDRFMIVRSTIDQPIQPSMGCWPREDLGSHDSWWVGGTGTKPAFEQPSAMHRKATPTIAMRSTTDGYIA